MGRILIINEKPSQAENFAKALGGRSGVFDGQNYQICNLVGHVMEFVEPEKQVPATLAPKYKSWQVDNLPWHASDFAWGKHITQGKSDVVRNVKQLAAGCDEIALACDVDPLGEGQLLAAEVLIHLGLEKKKKLTRIAHMDESPDEVRKAFRERKPVPDIYRDREFVMATMRERWDFLSMQFTRLFSSYAPRGIVLRQGRLKSCMIVLVGDQEALVKAYKKVPFYENRFQDENGNQFSSKDEPRFPKKDQVPQKYGPSSVVVDKTEMKHTPPPKLLDLAALSSQMEPMGFGSALVLKTYQDMYTKCIVSYPRTEDKFVSPGQFDEMLPLVDRIAAVVGVDPRLLTHRRPRKTHVQAGGAHGANRPGKAVPQSLDALEASYGKCGRVIYEILARNYLAMLCEDYEYQAQSGHVKDYPGFTGTASVPMKPGWKRVFKDEWSGEEESSGKGLGKTASPFIHEGFPPKPAAPTFKWLMKELEKRDVGTGATRVSTYSDVTNAKSKNPIFTAKRGKIVMAPCGAMSYILLKGTNIGDLGVTERVYGQIKAVADGKADMKACLDDIERLVREDILTTRNNAAVLKKEMGNTMEQNGYEQAERFTGTWAKTGAQVSPKRVWGGHRFTDEEVEKLLAGDEITFSCKGQSGDYEVTGKLDTGEYNGHQYVGFQKTATGAGDGPERFKGTWKGKDVSPKRVWGGHRFTDEEVEKLLGDKEITFTCTGKNGDYEVKGRLANCTYNGHKYVGFSRTDRK